jgi:type VI secretion system protein ImpA
MGTIDVDQLLQEVSSESPCGDDLEYDPAFAEMERAAQGKPEQQFGDTVVPSEEPNWPEVKKQALELLSRTKDLRVAVYLIRALVRTDGLLGLSEGLALLRRFLDRYWDEVHPRLDPEDDNDPTLRVNTIASLCGAETTLQGVRRAPLVSAGALGRFSLRDVEVAAGAVPVPAGTEVPDLSSIEAAFTGCEIEGLQATAEAVAQSVEQATAIEALLVDRVGVGQALDLSSLTDTLKSAGRILSERLARRGGEGTVGLEESAATGAAAGAAPAGRPVPVPVAGQITSRQDVIRALDRVCEYFERNEPSSPVPMLLRRARRLVSKSFLEIIQDVAPDGLSQVELLRGPQESAEEIDNEEA